jgi:hypothetical protein
MDDLALIDGARRALAAVVSVSQEDVVVVDDRMVSLIADVLVLRQPNRCHDVVLALIALLHAVVHCHDDAAAALPVLLSSLSTQHAHCETTW